MKRGLVVTMVGLGGGFPATLTFGEPRCQGDIPTLHTHVRQPNCRCRFGAAGETGGVS